MALEGFPQRPAFPGLAQTILNQAARVGQPLRSRSTSEITQPGEGFDIPTLGLLIYMLMQGMGGGGGTIPGLPGPFDVEGIGTTLQDTPWMI